MVDQTVLCGDLGGGVSCGCGADAILLHQNHIHSSLLELPGRQEPRQSSADHQNIGANLSVQVRMLRE